MNNPASDHTAEHDLARLIRRQTEEYRTARETLRGLSISVTNDASVAAGRLEGLLEQFQQRQSQVDVARRAWESLGRRPGPDLQAAIEDQQQLLEGMLSDVDRVQQGAETARQRVLPRLDAASRSSQMQTAYGRAAGSR